MITANASISRASLLARRIIGNAALNKNIGKNLIAYLNGFSENMRDVFEKFKLRNTIDTLNQKGLTYMLVEKFAAVDLHPDRVSNHEMGTIFEELISKFNEQTNENPGEHFTPREVIRLMVKLLINGDKAILKQQAVLRTVFDPACGTGGMLSIAKEYIQAEINPQADIRLFGQEVNDETYAICKSDMYLKRDDRDADNIKPDSSFSHDGHSGSTFDYMLCNPPYGKDWNKEKKFIEEEAARGAAGRFEAGLPRSSDGQLLFLLHMLSKMKPPAEGGSRVAIIMNGSPLFTGDAGKGALPVLSIPSSMQKNDCEESIPLLPWLEALLLETSERERFGWCFNPVSLQLKLNRPVRHQRPTAEWVSRISAASARSPVSSSDRRRARVILTLHHRMTFADRAANGWRWPVFPSERLLRCYAMPT